MGWVWRGVPVGGLLQDVIWIGEKAQGETNSGDCSPPFKSGNYFMGYCNISSCSNTVLLHYNI